jgi:hypothetical protein
MLVGLNILGCLLYHYQCSDEGVNYWIRLSGIMANGAILITINDCSKTVRKSNRLEKEFPSEFRFLIFTRFMSSIL